KGLRMSILLNAEATKDHGPTPSVTPRAGRGISRLVMRATVGLFAGSLWVAAIGQESGDNRGQSVTSAQNAGGQFQQRLQSIVKRASGTDTGGRALVVLPSGGDPKAQGELREDLVVMHHLLDKAVDESLGSDQRYRKALGVDLVFAPDSSQLRQAYLEGYGALFLFRVHFPLLPQASKMETKPEERETNSAWEAARQEVFGENPAPSAGLAVQTEPYSEERVAHLKNALLGALKNAANIRGLKQEEGVTVCVFGAAKAAAGHAGMAVSGVRPGELALISGPYGGAQKGTMLTIRAKKSDIDAFAKGQINAEEFAKAAQVAVYESETGGEMGWFTGPTTGGGAGWGYGR
ncbi:MAG TPA: hypothetical protein VHI52_04335, partial [Verrucomicrobiae bacterium]|nr:hypothetical protein [Verrucomicrobiae bacterium]